MGFGYMNVLPGTPVDTHPPVTVVRTSILQSPMTRETFAKLGRTKRREYLVWLRDTFGVTQSRTAEMMGVTVGQISQDCKELEIAWPRRRMTAEEIERWTRFVDGEPVQDVVCAKNAQTTQEIQEQETPELTEPIEMPEKTEEQEMDEEGGWLECDAPDPGEATPEERQELMNVLRKVLANNENAREDIEKMCVYVSGAISGRTDYKERFAAAEKALQEQGHTVMNPAMNGEGWSYRQYINIGLMELMHCDAIYMLHGWQDSVGARLELEYARATGLRVMYQES